MRCQLVEATNSSRARTVEVLVTGETAIARSHALPGYEDEQLRLPAESKYVGTSFWANLTKRQGLCHSEIRP